MEYMIAVHVGVSEANKSTPLKRCKLDFASDNFSVNNIYPAETNDAGKCYRWTGPHSKTTFTINIDRTEDRVIEVEVMSFASDQIRELLSFYVDGEKIKAKQKGMIFSIPIKQSKDRYGLETVLLIDTCTTINQFEQGLGPDKRSLGVAVSNLEVV
jgi:hypothetical protein